MILMVIVLGIPATSMGASDTFVTRQGGALTIRNNGVTMGHFAGANVSWLGLLENPTSSGDGIHYPSHAEVDAVMNDAQAMSANVLRTFGALSVGCSLCIEPSLGVFNDGTNGKPNAFDSLDYAIAAAKSRDIRFIMPLVDNAANYIGGKLTYLAWRNITADSVGSQFFTDSVVRQDFKDHISAVLNHVNPYTGLAYKNEPTIMAWETGNELSIYPTAWNNSAWTGHIANYIKTTLGSRQLVADGHYGIYTIEATLDTASLQLLNVDMYSNHAYDNYRPPQEIVNESNVVHSYGKVYFLGEYSWTGIGDGGVTLTWTLHEMLSMIENNNVTGDMYWQLFPNGINHGDGYDLHYPPDNPNIVNAATQFVNHAKRHVHITVRD
jgi:mannan endo-1,4-beta-mannosidase